jgi:hypothetical protein
VQLAPVIPLGARVVVPEVLQGLAPKLARVAKSPVAAGIALMTSETGLELVTVSTPVVALVAPTGVLGNEIADVALNVPFTPVPLRATNWLPLGASTEGTVSVPLKSLTITLMPLAVKVIPIVQVEPGVGAAGGIVPGNSVAPEHVSDVVAKFGGSAPGGPELVAAVTVPTWIMDPDVLRAVTNPSYVTVLPLTPPYIEAPKIAAAGVT